MPRGNRRRAGNRQACMRTIAPWVAALGLVAIGLAADRLRRSSATTGAAATTPISSCATATRRSARDVANVTDVPRLELLLPPHRARAGTCWLKNSVPPRGADQCCISGVRGAGVIEPRQGVVEYSIDRYGGDFRISIWRAIRPARPASSPARARRAAAPRLMCGPATCCPRRAAISRTASRGRAQAVLHLGRGALARASAGTAVKNRDRRRPDGQVQTGCRLIARSHEPTSASTRPTRFVDRQQADAAVARPARGCRRNCRGCRPSRTDARAAPVSGMLSSGAARSDLKIGCLRPPGSVSMKRAAARARRSRSPPGRAVRLETDRLAVDRDAGRCAARCGRPAGRSRA